MIVIAGLGNPENKYTGTRHNIGFDVIDYLSEKYQISVDTNKFKALIGKGMIGSEKVILVKPLTYMNLSGESIREVVDFYKIDPESELIIIHDDISLDPGQLRLRKKGSAGGHNGIKNIIAHIGDKFMRIKMGVGEKPPMMDLADYVLGHFPKEQWPVIKESVEHAADAVRMITEGDFDAAMNRYNQKTKG